MSVDDDTICVLWPGQYCYDEPRGDWAGTRLRWTGEKLEWMNDFRVAFPLEIQTHPFFVLGDRLYSLATSEPMTGPAGGSSTVFVHDVSDLHAELKYSFNVSVPRAMAQRFELPLP